MIKVLNKYGQELKSPDVIEVQWNRKYFDVGDFSVYMTASEYSPDIKYVSVENRKETGIVQKVVYEERPEGEFVTLSGFFIDKLLDWGMFSEFFSFKLNAPTNNDVMEAVKLTLYKAFYQVTDNLKNSLNPNSLGGSFYKDPFMLPVFYETTVAPKSIWPKSGEYSWNVGQSIGEGLREMLKKENMSMIVKPVFNPSKNDSEPLLGLNISTYQGVDRQKDIYFGEAWHNVKNIELMEDDSNNRSNLVAVQTVPDDAEFSRTFNIWHESKWQKVIYEYYRYPNNNPAGLGNCNPVKVIFTQANEVTKGNEASVRNQMKQALNLELLNNYKQEQVSVDVIQNTFIYGKDYDLGDICTVSVDKLQRQYNARIIEVHEVYKKNMLEVQLVLGTPFKKEYRRVII